MHPPCSPLITAMLAATFVATLAAQQSAAEAWLAFQKLPPARQQQAVAALIDGESTLKRYLLQRGRPFLRAENPRYPDLLPANELIIQGVMVGLLRTQSN